jgi:hypothetical protein
MKVKTLSFTLLLALLTCWSCSFHNVDDDLRFDCATSPVSFADTIFPIFVKYCSNNANGDCHWTGASIPKPDYTTYAGIKAKVDDGRIQARLFDGVPTFMPPSQTLGPPAVSDCDKTLIQRWMDDGAPNN